MRSPGSPRTCATEPSSIPDAVADAFVDRAPIDWEALLARARHPGERASLDALRRLEMLRGSREPGAVAPGHGGLAIVVRLLVALAAAQTLAGLLQAVKTIAVSGASGGIAPGLLVVLSFTGAGLLLGSASARDRRVLPLLATFTFAAAAFARPLAGLPGSALLSSGLFRGLVPEAFVAAALWRFAVLFPTVRRFTRFDVWSRRVSSAVWVVCSVLFAINLAAGYAFAGPLHVLRRDDPGNLFWHLFALMALPAFAAIFLRAHRSPAAERAKAVRLGCALAVSAAPLLLVGLARLLLDTVDRWMTTSGSGGRMAIDGIVMGALAAMPVLVTLAVIADRPFALHAGVPGSLRGWLAGPRLRRRREWLLGALARVSSAAGAQEVAAILTRELQFGVRAASVHIVARGDLPRDSALPLMLEESAAPVLLARDAEPYLLLPPRDREWLDARDAALVAPVRARGGAVAAIAVLGPRRSGGAYDRTDRWFAATLLTAAAPAWETRASDRERDERTVAWECPRCGQVAAAVAACGCGARLVPAALPHSVAGKFEVQRRLGAGGMGIVYLARDLDLGRDVALKTLPRRDAGAVARLREEARAMVALNHPSLATIYGLEVWRGAPVLVVEYFEAGTLADRLARGALSPAEVIALGVQLADALACMHARGLLHRDVKPSNIGYTVDGAAKLLDFGLSDAGPAAAGTPGYLPPEAFGAAPPDEHVDLWGLAVVLYEASGEVQDAALAAFFHRALAPVREERFPSAVAIREALGPRRPRQ